MPQWVSGQCRTLAEGVRGAEDGWVTGLAGGRSRLQPGRGCGRGRGGPRGGGQQKPGQRSHKRGPFKVQYNESWNSS